VIPTFNRNQQNNSMSENGKQLVSGGRAKTPALSKRHSKTKKERGITKNAIERLARRGGNPRLSGKVYGEARNIIDYFIDHIVRVAVEMARYSKRKTIYTKDVRYALEGLNRPLYGV
jgi:histone H4